MDGVQRLRCASSRAAERVDEQVFRAVIVLDGMALTDEHPGKHGDGQVSDCLRR
jgi:hypothetical protein